MASVANTVPATANQKRLVAEAFTTLPVLPNVFPYNELLISGKLNVGSYGVKTRGWPMCVWKYRGPVLLYTSTKTHQIAADAHGLDSEVFPRQVIVGVGKLVEIRNLTRGEKKQMYLNFNNWGEKEYRSFLRAERAGRWVDHISPFYAGLFFKNLKRFKKPIPFTWKKGAITLNHAPLSLVVKALKEVGYQV